MTRRYAAVLLACAALSLLGLLDRRGPATEAAAFWANVGGCGSSGGIKGRGILHRGSAEPEVRAGG